MSASPDPEPTDGGEEVAPTRTHELLRTIRAYADPAVDIAAVFAIALVVHAAPSEAVMQVAAPSIATVAVGKRYITREVRP